MNKHNYDLFNEISVTEKEIEEWIDREAPHISNLRSRRKYYAKYTGMWQIKSDKLIKMEISNR